MTLYGLNAKRCNHSFKLVQKDGRVNDLTIFFFVERRGWGIVNHRDKQAGVNIDEVRLKRAEERRKQREKLANLQTCTGATFPHVRRVHYYNRENAPMVQLIPATLI